MAHKFGDFFHEIPEPEVFPLPCGGSVSSECVINSLGLTYTVEVIPRQTMIEKLSALPCLCRNHGVALGFRIVEHAGAGVATIYTEPNGIAVKEMLIHIDAGSLPSP